MEELNNIPEYYRVRKTNEIYSVCTGELSRKRIYRCDRKPPQEQLKLSDEQIRKLWAQRQQCQDDAAAVAEIDLQIRFEFEVTDTLRMPQKLRAVLINQVALLSGLLGEVSETSQQEWAAYTWEKAEARIQEDTGILLNCCQEILNPDYFQEPA